MKYLVIKDAPVLIPNKEHENFTESKDFIPKGFEIEGTQKQIKGKRRGQPFVYKLFLTKDDKLIYPINLKPMTTTEVTLGADAAQSETIVNIPAAKKLFTKNVIIGTLVGAAAGFGLAKYKKWDKKKMALSILVGTVAGFGIMKYVEKRKPVTVKPSK